MLIDIHTHHQNSNNLKDQITFVDDLHFVGLHPWFITEDYVNQMEKIKRRHTETLIPLIGETGLDRLKSPVSFELQLKVFYFHLELAEKLERPLVIHCLKAHSDFLQILKTKKFNIKFIIHDYSGGEKELKEYLKFEAYFSFGRSLFRENSKAQMVFKKVPLDRIFLETDDEKELEIEKVYRQAEKLLNRSDLEDIILRNFLAFFNYSNDLRPSDFIKNIC